VRKPPVGIKIEQWEPLALLYHFAPILADSEIFWIELELHSSKRFEQGSWFAMVKKFMGG
jgi:hypothetical protein